MELGAPGVRCVGLAQVVSCCPGLQQLSTLKECRSHQLRWLTGLTALMSSTVGVYADADLAVGALAQLTALQRVVLNSQRLMRRQQMLPQA
jgi:hypothetical protein